MPRCCRAAGYSMILSLLVGCVTSPAASRAKDFEDASVERQRRRAMLLISIATEPGNVLDEHLLQDTKRVLISPLSDPEGATFRNVRVVSTSDGKIVCGEMNQNGFGGDSGYKPFAGIFLLDLNIFSELKRNSSEEFYNRMVEAYMSGYVAVCQ